MGKHIAIREWRPIFGGGRVTSDAEGLLLRELDRRDQVTAKVADLQDYRNSRKVRPELFTLVQPRLLVITRDYEDADDAATLGSGSSLQDHSWQGPGECRSPGLPADLSCFENRFAAKDLRCLSESLLELNPQTSPSPRKVIVLDPEASDAPSCWPRLPRCWKKPSGRMVEPPRKRGFLPGTRWKTAARSSSSSSRQTA